MNLFEILFCCVLWDKPRTRSHQIAATENSQRRCGHQFEFTTTTKPTLVDKKVDKGQRFSRSGLLVCVDQLISSN